MAANKKFTPRASSNLIEEEVTENKETNAVDNSAEDVAEDTAEVVAPEVENEAEAVDNSDEEVDDTPAEDDEKANAEAPTEDNKNDEVTFTATTNTKPLAKMVKIRLAKKYDGCIGGVWYHFAKDQVVTVPENVKRILNSTEGMLKPL